MVHPPLVQPTNPSSPRTRGSRGWLWIPDRDTREHSPALSAGASVRRTQCRCDGALIRYSREQLAGVWVQTNRTRG